MKWTKFTLKTTTEAVDLISSMLDEIGIEGWLSQFFISDFCSQLILLSFQGIQTFLGRSGE